MGDVGRPIIYTFIIAVLICIFAFAGITEASMPDYQRLAPITSVFRPMAVAVDNDGNLYVTEPSRNRLRVFTQGGIYKDTLVGLNNPISVGVDDNGRILIGNHYDDLLDRGNVEVYGVDLNFLFKLGTGDGEFSQPSSIAIDSPSGNIYVADKKSNVIKVFGPDGGHSFSFDGTLNSGGQFYKPSSIIINSGEIIVLDHPLTLTQDNLGNDVWVNGARVQFFEMNGAYKDGFNKYGMNVGDLFKPVDLAIDNEGRIYVSDTQHDILLVYDRNGEYLGAVYDENNPFRIPLGITISNGNILYVASLRSARAGRVETYGVSPFAQIELDPISLSWEENREAAPSSQTVQIRNNGDKQLGWSASASIGWITLSDTYGTLIANGSYSLNIGVDLTGLQPGIHTGSVNISADYGAVERVSIELSVVDVQIGANPNGPYSVIEGQTVVLDGSGSNVFIALYEWDIDGDETYDYSSTQPFQDHIYSDSGTYAVKLRVTDALDGQDEASVNVTVLDDIPTADFTVSPTEGEAPHTVNFANNSTGYDQPLTYEWDFDNNGTIDSNGANPSYTYNYPGMYSVKLTVTDSDGSTDYLIRTNYLAVTDESGCSDFYVKNGPLEYSFFQHAFNAARDGDYIKVRNVTLGEVIAFNRNITLTMSGGYDCDYSVRDGKTILNGNITVSKGVLILEDFILE